MRGHGHPRGRRVCVTFFVTLEALATVCVHPRGIYCAIRTQSDQFWTSRTLLLSLSTERRLKGAMGTRRDPYQLCLKSDGRGSSKFG